MIPAANTILTADILIDTIPSLNYAMQFKKAIISGKIDNLDAMRQVIFKILNTERYDYIIYSWNYGIELKDLGEKLSAFFRRINDFPFCFLDF